MSTPVMRAGAVTAATLVLALGVFAQGDGITVSGTGSVTTEPDRMIVRVTVQGEAEVASDALAQFNSARARAVEAFKKLGIEGLTVEGEGAKIDAGIAGNVNQVFMIGGGGNQSGPVTKVHVKETLRLDVPAIGAQSPKQRTETAAKILDTAKDAGLKLVTSNQNPNVVQNIWTPGGTQTPKPTGLISFIPKNMEQAETAAFKAALEASSKKAKALADLSGRQLGRVQSIQVVSRKQSADQNAQAIKMEVTLKVVFSMS